MSRSLHPHLDWWLSERNVLWGQPLHPLHHALQMITGASNEGWGAHLGDSTARDVWSDTEKSHSHQPLGVKGSLSGFKELRASLQRQDCPHSNRQHHCGLLHQQAVRYEIRLSLCPPLETTVLVSPQRDNLAGSTHSKGPRWQSGNTLASHL